MYIQCGVENNQRLVGFKNSPKNIWLEMNANKRRKKRCYQYEY